MKIRLYITLMLLSLFSVQALGQFDPSSPPEPNKLYQVKLLADPAEAATLSGAGHYAVNKSVSISASINDAKWKFVNWTDEDGQEVSTTSSFSYKVINKNRVFTAHYVEVATSTVSVSAEPANAGTDFSMYLADNSSTKSGVYKVGSTVSVTAGSYSNWTFQHWKIQATDEVVSTSRSFTYTVPEGDVHLVAHYKFTPGSQPGEPNMPQLPHKVYYDVSPNSDAGYINVSGYISNTHDSSKKVFSVKEGNSFSLTAYNYSGWKFSHWTLDGETVSTGSMLTAVMGNADRRYVAHYVFNPSGPNEPNPDTKPRLSLYGQTVSLYRYSSMLYPLYLENTAEVKDIALTLRLPEGLTVDTEGIQTTSRTAAYTVTPTLEGQLLSLNITGGTSISGNNGPFVQIPITATEALTDGTYDMSFTANTITLADETTATAGSRGGKLQVSTLDEGDVQAIFSLDQTMNRVQFTNLSTEGCKTYVWDFGDGTTSTEHSPRHDYATPGTYTVTLSATGIVKTSVMEGTVTIADPATWTSGGDYTLNRTDRGIRNFGSLHEAIAMLSQCRPVNNIIIHVTDGGSYTLNAAPADSLALLQALTKKLTDNAKTLQYVAPIALQGTTLNIDVTAESQALKAALAHVSILQLQNVVAQINGAELHPAILDAIGAETVCGESPTAGLPLTALSSSDRVTVEWTAVVKSGNTLANYLQSGTGDLPVMEITNEASSMQSVEYHIIYKLDGVEIHSATHTINVRPLLKYRTLNLSSPADNATINFGNQTLNWTNLNSLVTGYTLYLQRTDEESPVRTYEVTTYSRSVYCEPGASYTWHVVAHGTCDDLESTSRSFTVREQADLTVESIEVPEQSAALKDLKVKAVIRNIGLGTTIRTSWTDALYYSTSADLTSPVSVAEKNHSGALAPDGSYKIEFTVKAPDAELGQIYYYVMTDYNDYEDESNEANNRSTVSPMTIAESYMDMDDYEALKVLNQAANGEIWNKKWNIATNAINSTAWPGVTFNEDGRVIAIDLNNNNLSGELPTEGFNLPLLKTLRLSYNNLRGDVAAFVKDCPALTTLDMDHCQITEILSPLPTNLTSIDLSYQYYNKSLSSLEKQSLAMSSVLENVELTSLFAYNHAAGDFSAHPDLRIYTTGGSYLGLLQYGGTGYGLKLNGDYNQAAGIDVVLEAYGGVAIYSRMPATLSWISGDANADGEVGLPDAQQTLNRILRKDSGNFNFAAANTYTDEIINVQDVVATIDKFIVEEEEEQSGAKAKYHTHADAPEVVGALYTTENGIYLNTEVPVAALDFTLSGIKASQMGLQLNRNDFQMYTHETANGLRVVIISPTGQEIASGLMRLFRISVEGVEVLNVKGVDANAQTLQLEPGEGKLTAIEELEAADHAAEGLYDLQGRRLSDDATLPAGIYIKNGRKIITK